jgi:hypothetical protein
MRLYAETSWEAPTTRPARKTLENRLWLAYKSSMSTLTEIERAADALPLDQQENLLEWLSERTRRRRPKSAAPHSVLDIAPVSLGRVIRALSTEDDVLGEMLEDRQKRGN